jgi:hypothetical protein
VNECENLVYEKNVETGGALLFSVLDAALRIRNNLNELTRVRSVIYMFFQTERLVVPCLILNTFLTRELRHTNLYSQGWSNYISPAYMETRS